MHLPAVRPSINSVPPMYAWPRSVKRSLLLLSVVAVFVAYVLLAGGVIAFLALLTEWIG